MPLMASITAVKNGISGLSNKEGVVKGITARATMKHHVAVKTSLLAWKDAHVLCKKAGTTESSHCLKLWLCFICGR